MLFIMIVIKQLRPEPRLEQEQSAAPSSYASAPAASSYLQDQLRPSASQSATSASDAPGNAHEGGIRTG